MDSLVYFVENLTFRTWLFSVWPRLFRNRLRNGGRRRDTQVYVIDGSWLAMLIARATALVASVPVEKLVWSRAELCDEAGMQVCLQIRHYDLAQVQQDAIAEPAFQELLQGELVQDRLPIFLAKKIVENDPSKRSSIWRALVLIQLCRWNGQQDNEHGILVLFLERRPWLKSITRYASLWGVAIEPVNPSLSLQAALRHRLPPGVIDVLRRLRYRLSRRKRSRPQGKMSSRHPVFISNVPVGHQEESRDAAQGSGPRLAVEYYGQLNLNHPELHSDLFFWQRSSLEGNNVLIMFSNPIAPLDEPKWAQLREHGVAAVVLHPGATTLPNVPVFTHRRRVNRTWDGKLLFGLKRPQFKWLREQVADYHALRSYWSALFTAYNVKVYVTWYTNDGTHCAIADALQSLGGITVIYQRSYESHPSVEATVSADIVFGFSQAVAQVQCLSNSVISYHVTTGYIGDHRFPLLQGDAQKVRDRLQQHGARRILAYFDENTVDDARWLNGHHWTQENYGFLLEKVLAEPWFGLVIKPKTPRTLRRRLGQVAEVLKRAEATGRCYVFEGDDGGQGWYPPAAAALASDVAVHGHMCAGTAGMEAALAGVPTLLLDREGWPVSPLYRLGIGCVVFTHWEGLWEACLRHWSAPGGVPGFGDWSPLLDELDPFRDGRAAERMGTYIQWLIEGFKAGLDRETIMADAAERYCTLWGRDKVREVNGRLQRVQLWTQ